LTLIFILTFGFEFDLDLDFGSDRQGHGFKSLPLRQALRKAEGCCKAPRQK